MAFAPANGSHYFLVAMGRVVRALATVLKSSYEAYGHQET